MAKKKILNKELLSKGPTPFRPVKVVEVSDKKKKGGGK